MTDPRAPIFNAIRDARPGKPVWGKDSVDMVDTTLDNLGVPREAADKPATSRKTLVGALGGGAAAVAAAVALFTSIPADESGRKVVATVTPDGAATITHVSGPQYLKTYLDIVKVPTACDGITKGVQLGQTYTPAQCTELLERELVAHAEGVMACTPSLAGRTNQQVAAVSLAYNVGVGAYCKSTVDRLFDAKSWRAGCDALLSWNKAGGKVVAGLVARRQREREICLKGL